MNFLSHFYFERYATQSERVLGSLLPDLLKNVDKSYVFHPQRQEEELFAHPLGMAISEGWYRHVEVDKLFHSSEFFLNHCHVLRKQIEPVLEGLPIRASFMAHIAVELLLDHLLIEHELVNVSRLYEHLEQVNRTVLRNYLETLGVADTPGFFQFYDQFLAHRYIFEYKDINQIARPLFNISKRVWDFQTTAAHREGLTAVLTRYKLTEMHNFKDIYVYIQDNLTYLS
ncbi:ACP phosphodiesterase [Sphingobacterium humi]|uniref:DUF479 domain-containing protein n=1 Tax=Sphingobacterium humi TaxID=1796905 RepID=A0A6N8L0X3_9SPHI|nr:hypothetical protein [Sphingobacterium humi]MVZ63395.1 hypothetical protein [Sphingobacterium humi]